MRSCGGLAGLPVSAAVRAAVNGSGNGVCELEVTLFLWIPDSKTSGSRCPGILSTLRA